MIIASNAHSNGCGQNCPINCDIQRKCSSKPDLICTINNKGVQKTFINNCQYENDYCNVQPAYSSKYFHNNIKFDDFCYELIIGLISEYVFYANGGCVPNCQSQPRCSFESSPICAINKKGLTKTYTNKCIYITDYCGGPALEDSNFFSNFNNHPLLI